MFSGMKPQCVMMAGTPIIFAKSAPFFKSLTRRSRISSGTTPSVTGPSVKFQRTTPLYPAHSAQGFTPVAALWSSTFFARASE